jgi:hypothetical protein
MTLLEYQPFIIGAKKGQSGLEACLKFFNAFHNMDECRLHTFSAFTIDRKEALFIPAEPFRPGLVLKYQEEGMDINLCATGEFRGHMVSFVFTEGILLISNLNENGLSGEIVKEVCAHIQ